MLKRTGFIFLLFLFTAAVPLIPSCKNSEGQTEEEPIVKTPVRVVPVAYKPISSTVDLPAVTCS